MVLLKPTAWNGDKEYPYLRVISDLTRQANSILAKKKDVKKFQKKYLDLLYHRMKF